MKKQKTKREIINLSDHDKLINLISIHNEKDVNLLLQSVDRVFIEVFDFKKKDLPWLSNNSEAEWDNVIRKVRLSIFKLYYEYVRREGLSLMKNYIKNKIKDRLTYCQDWKHSIDLYLANKEITQQADKEFYKTRPILKLVLDIYFLPYNLWRLLRYLRIKHDYQKNEIEIEILNKQIKGNENQK